MVVEQSGVPPLVPSLWTEDDHDRRVRVPWRIALDVETPEGAGGSPEGVDDRVEDRVVDGVDANTGTAADRRGAGPSARPGGNRPGITTALWHATRRLVRTGPGLLIAAGVFGALLVGVIGLLGGVSVLAWLFVSPVSGAVIILAVGVAVAVRRELQERGDAVKLLALGRGVCPACGYAVAKLAPAADGCVTCPECAAAWRLPSGDPRGPIVMRAEEMGVQ
jgi:hypothetical protein